MSLTYNGSTSTWIASAAPQGGATGNIQAWVNFDGTKDSTGTASTSNTNRYIRASSNVASVLRNATGDYTITFSTPFANTNYIFSAGAGTGNGRLIMLYNGTYNTNNSSSAKTVSTMRICYGDTNIGSFSDNTELYVSIIA